MPGEKVRMTPFNLYHLSFYPLLSNLTVSAMCTILSRVEMERRSVISQELIYVHELELYACGHLHSLYAI